MAGIAETLTLEFDGGSRGNPGPAGIGVVVRAADGTPLVTLGRFIGRATNNVAEYNALITAMQEAQKLGASKVFIRGDSELIIKQMRGEYRVRHSDMIPLHRKARQLFDQFASARIEHNLRHKNELADKLANLAMDRKQDVTDADEPASPLAGFARLSRVNTMPDPAEDSPSSPCDDPPAQAAPKPGDIQTCPRCGCGIEIRKASSLRPQELKAFTCQCGAKMVASSNQMEKN